MTKRELKERQVRDAEQLIGKTIKTVVDDDDPNVLLIFTDDTFAIIDSDPEGDGVGFSLDAWPLENEELCDKLSRLLS